MLTSAPSVLFVCKKNGGKSQMAADMSEAVVDPIAGMAGTIETWTTVEPSDDGIDGPERMRLIRDDIAARVTILAAELITT